MTTQPQAESNTTPQVDDLATRLSEFSTYDVTPAEALELVEEARSQCPVAHSERFGGFEMLFGYDDVKRAASDWRTFSSTPSALRPLVDRPPALAIDWDPPEHTSWRTLIKLGVDHTTPGRVESAVREDVVALIDRFATRGECDLVADLAEQVPLLAICHILGFDVDKRAEVRRLSLQLVSSLGTPELVPAAFQAFNEFAVRPVLERRGASGEDFLTRLANADWEGVPLTEEQIATIMIGLLVAGHETTVSALASLFYEVLARPEIRDQLVAEPELIPAAVEEALRLHPPVFGFFRRATEAVSIGGVEIPEDGTAYLCWAAANRDPDTFEDPGVFRLDRGRQRHLTFGFGLHTCPGAPVARAEMVIVLTELLRTLPTITLGDVDQVTYEFGGSETMAIRSLPARF